MLRDAAVPKIRPHGEWTKEANAAPVSCEIRTDNYARNLGSKSVLRIGEPSSPNVGSVSHESHRVRQTDERPKREPHDRIGRREFSQSGRASCRERVEISVVG